MYQVKIKHIGIRPKNELISKDTGVYYEILPDGKRRVWHKRMLKSGCNNTFDNTKNDDLIYCPFCDEYFSSNQFLVIKESE